MNEADAIANAFEPFYDASLAIPTDPNALFDARRELDQFDVLRQEDVDALAEAWFGTQASGQHGALHTHLAPAVTRFEDLDEDDEEAFRTALDRFVSLYTFITQILPLAETELEKRYLSCRLLALRLPARPSVRLDVDVALTHLRVAETGRQAIAPDGGGSQCLPGMEPLSEVITRFNEAFDGEIADADRLNIDGLGARMVDDALLQAQAVANTDASFAQVFEDRFGEFVAGHLKGNEELLIRLLDDDRFRLHLTRLLVNAVGEAATSQVSVALESADGHDVARVHVEPSAFPVSQDVQGVATLWVRLDAGTRGITDPTEVERYVATRWPGTAT